MRKKRRFGSTHTLRRPWHDYAADGVYHVTMRTATETNLFGTLSAQGVRLNSFGRIAAEELQRSVSLRSELAIDTYVIMPDHIHMIVRITVSPDASLHTKRHYTSASPFLRRRKTTWLLHGKVLRPKGPRPRSLGAFVAGYKGVVAARINNLRGTQGHRVWSRSYHDKLIRNVVMFRFVWRYIQSNPKRAWEKFKQTLS